MVSVITCVSNPDQYKAVCLPTLLATSTHLRDWGLPALELIQVAHSDSIYAAYNEGARRGRYPIKIYIHQDVDLLEVSWIYKVMAAFTDPTVGVVGLVGTTVLGTHGLWWQSGQDHIVGSVWSGLERADWCFGECGFAARVQCVDGFFLATRCGHPWDESLGGFHLYDMDYCRTAAVTGHKIVVVPHKAWHIGAIRTQSIDFRAYYTKWGLE